MKLLEAVKDFSKSCHDAELCRLSTVFQAGSNTR